MSAKNNIKGLFTGLGFTGWAAVCLGGLGLAGALVLGTVISPVALGLIGAGVATLATSALGATSLFKGIKTNEAEKPSIPWFAAGATAAAAGILSLTCAFSQALQGDAPAQAPQAFSQAPQTVSQSFKGAAEKGQQEYTTISGRKIMLPDNLGIVG